MICQLSVVLTVTVQFSQLASTLDTREHGMPFSNRKPRPRGAFLKPRPHQQQCRSNIVVQWRRATGAPGGRPRPHPLKMSFITF